MKGHRDYSLQLGLLTKCNYKYNKRDIFFDEDIDNESRTQLEFFHKLAQEYVAGKYFISKTPEILLATLSAMKMMKKGWLSISNTFFDLQLGRTTLLAQ